VAFLSLIVIFVYLQYQICEFQEDIFIHSVRYNIRVILNICSYIYRETISSKTDRETSTTKPYEKKKKSSGVDCGRPVNSTQFDHLRGLINRNSHPHIPEPEVAMIFRSKSNPEVDMTMLQNQLRKTKKEVNSCFNNNNYQCK